MTGDEISQSQALNAWVSLGTALACLLFVVTYAVLARWWTSTEGWILMGKAFAIMLLAAYSFLVVKVAPDSATLRTGRVAVVAVIGVFMVWQTVVMARAQLTRRTALRQEKARD